MAVDEFFMAVDFYFVGSSALGRADLDLV